MISWLNYTNKYQQVPPLLDSFELQERKLELVWTVRLLLDYVDIPQSGYNVLNCEIYCMMININMMFDIVVLCFTKNSFILFHYNSHPANMYKYSEIHLFIQC